MEWALLHQLVDQLPVALFAKDARPGRVGQFRIWNKTAETLFGIAAEDILGKTDYDLFPRDQADFFTAKDAEVMASGRRLSIPREPVDSPTLGRRWVRTEKVPLYDGAGAPEMLVGISEDITEDLAQESALQASARRLEEAQRIGRMGHWAWDIRTHGLTWSDEIFRIFGFEPGAFAPTYPAFLARVHPQDVALVEGAVRQTLEDRHPYSIDHRVVRPDGEVLTVHEQGEVEVDDEGQPVRMVGTVQDITERTLAERLQKEFVAMVSHELRTPLTAIRGALGLVVGHPTHALDPATRSLLEVALRNSERLGNLINDILDLSKIEAGALDLHLAPLELDAIARQAVSAHAPLGAAKHLTLDVEAVSGARVMADEARLQQILGNLLANAVKFSPEGGSIEIKTWVAHGRAGVSVSNQGPEIPPDFRPRIFQRFAQADGSDSRAKSGTGLGLSITKALMERMGGRVDFDSGPDLTRFWVDFPTCA